MSKFFYVNKIFFEILSYFFLIFLILFLASKYSFLLLFFTAIPIITLNYRFYILRKTLFFYLAFFSILIYFFYKDIDIIYNFLLFPFIIAFFIGISFRKQRKFDRIFQYCFYYFLFLLFLNIFIKIDLLNYNVDLQKGINNIMVLLKGDKLNELVEWLKNVKNSQTIKDLQLIYDIFFPSFSFLFNLLLFLFNFILAKFLIELFQRSKIKFDSFNTWKQSDWFIWVFLLSWGATVFSSYVPITMVKFWAWNFSFLVSIPYFIQGISIINNFLARYKFSNLFKFLWIFILVNILGLYTSLLIFLIIALGLFDLWFDFRRLASQTESR